MAQLCDTGMRCSLWDHTDGIPSRVSCTSDNIQGTMGYGPTALLILLIKIIKINTIKRKWCGRNIKLADFNDLWKFLCPNIGLLRVPFLTHGLTGWTSPCCSFHWCLSQPSWLSAAPMAPTFPSGSGPSPCPFLTDCPQLLLLCARPSSLPWNPWSIWRGRALITSVVILGSPFVLFLLWHLRLDFSLLGVQGLPLISVSWKTPGPNQLTHLILLKHVLLPSLSTHPFPIRAVSSSRSTSLRCCCLFTYI